MRKSLLILLCVLLTHSVQAQLQKGFHYKIKNNYKILKWNYPLAIYYTTDSAKKDTSTRVFICKTNKRKGIKAGILQDEKDPTILRVEFWAIKATDTVCQKEANVINSSYALDDKHFFFLKIEKRKRVGDPTRFISLPYATTEFGLTTIPFKYRFGNKNDSIPNDASSAITGGLYVGRKWGRTRYYQDKTKTGNSLSYTVAIFCAPTVIALSPETTRNEVKVKSNELGVGFGGAFLISYRDINVGLLAGIDVPVSGDSGKWIYANRPWIGFGVGYKLAILNGGE